MCDSWPCWQCFQTRTAYVVSFVPLCSCVTLHAHRAAPCCCVCLQEALLLDLARDAGDERSRSAVNAAIPAAAWRQHQLQAAAARLAEKVEAQHAQEQQQEQQQPNGVHHHHHHDPESATSRRGQRLARPHTAGHARPYHDGEGAGTGAGVGAGHAATTLLAVGSGATAGFGLRSDVQQQQQAPYDSNKRQSVAPSEVYSSDDDDDD